MLGIEDPGIYWAYLLSIISALACIIYGIINWNKGAIEEDDIQESINWEKEDDKITDTL